MDEESQEIGFRDGSHGYNSICSPVINIVRAINLNGSTAKDYIRYVPMYLPGFLRLQDRLLWPSDYFGWIFGIE